MGKEHPARERLLARTPPFCREPVREVAKARIDVHLAVRIESGGMQTDAALEVPVHADPWRAGVPPIAVDILEGVAMAGALYESARLVRDGVVRRVGKRAQRVVGDVHAVGVNVV